MIPKHPYRSNVPSLSLLLVCFVLTVSFAGVAQTQGTFRAGINYPAGPPIIPTNTGLLIGGISPIEAHLADFNADGKVDVVAAATCFWTHIPNCPQNGYAVVVYLSNGDGTFQPAVVTGGATPALRSLAAGEFNGDGQPDVVTASDCLSDEDCSAGSIAIFLGNGDGTFSLAPSYALNGIVSQAYTLALGDFNDDGITDITAGIACYDIPVNSCSVGAVSILLGNGDGTFASPTVYPTVGNGTLHPIVGDFNGDGKLDVIAGSSLAPNDNSHSSLTLLLGAGNGTFAETVTPLPFSNLSGVSTVDLNLDDKPDVAITATPSMIQVLTGNGDGTFQLPTTYPTGLGSSYSNGVAPVVATDFNDDGRPDLVASGALAGFNGAVVLLNDGAGGLSVSGSYTAGGWNYFPIVASDFDADGKEDVIVVSGCHQDGRVDGYCSDGTLTVLLGNGDGTMRSARYLDEGSNAARPAVAAADIDGDGFQDLLFPSGCTTAHQCTPSGFTLRLSDGAGSYQAPVDFTAELKGAHFLKVDDFNGDTRPDVAVFNNCNGSCTAGSVSIFRNTGNGTFADPIPYDTNGSVPLTITTGDFNADGKRDIGLLYQCPSSCNGPGVIAILLGNGDGTFQPPLQTPLGSETSVWWMAAADFNGDLKTDLVVTENTYDPNDLYAGSAQILLSNGDGTFAFGGIYGTGGGRSALGNVGGESVTTGDVNGDGKPDIAIGNVCEPVTHDFNCARGAIGLLLGNGNGTFQPVTSQIVTDGNLWAISLGDVNNDGKLDEIASTSTGILVSFGNGDGTFQPPTIYAALQVVENVQLAIADLNNDGGLDIVQPGSNSQLAILYNQGFSNVLPVVTIESSLNPSIYGLQVIFNAFVTATSGTPTGTVTFTDGPDTLDTVNLANGFTSIQISLAAGTHSMVAHYSGDSNFQASSSAALSQIVNKASTEVILRSSANPSYPDQPVTFTANVARQSGWTVTGSVTFKQGNTTLAVVTLNNGQDYATYSTTYTTTGTRSISAIYSGDGNNLGSTSAVLKQVVKPLPAATSTILTTSGSPSFVNVNVNFRATITSAYGPIPDGETVTFYDGASAIGTGLTAVGVAVFSTSTLSAKAHTIKAIYAGDATFKSSTGKVTQVVQLYSSTTSVATSPNPSTFGQAVALTATVNSGAPSGPTGNVTFKNGSITLGTATLNGGTALLSTTKLPAGSLTITAIFNGDAQSAKSSGTTGQTVNQATTTTSLISSRNPSAGGQVVKFTATVASPTASPTGSITFLDGATALANVSLFGGKASYSTSALAPGTHDITAVYPGTANTGPSTSPVLLQTVN